jgi:thiamine-monophosphate kinase
MSELDVIASENELIHGYLAPLAAGCPGAFGLTEDCAVLAPQAGEDLVLTTDAIAEGVHFLQHDAPGDIAWKALAVNVSDLIAKGAKPVGYLMSLAFPEAPARVWMQGFAAGLAEAQQRLGLVLLGGDTDRRPAAPLSITIMALGCVPSGRMLRRGGARPGDRLYVSGSLGDAALGLRIRRQPAAALAWPLTAVERDFLTRRYLRPEPRTGLRDVLLGHAEAAMDISDGLAKDMGRLCQAAAVSAEVHVERLPLSVPARKVFAACPEWAEAPLSGGDDYEILAAVAQEKTAAFEAAAQDAGIAVTQIGGCTGGGSGVTFRGSDGQLLPLTNTGYEHF